jgi:hypothetical protein
VPSGPCLPIETLRSADVDRRTPATPLGSWDVEWLEFGGEGEVRERRRGEWRLAWVPGGHGVLDVISTVGGPRDEDVVTLRCWDAQLGAWRIVYMSPGDRQFATMVGRPDGDRILQDIVDPPSGDRSGRWIFSDRDCGGFSEVLRSDSGAPEKLPVVRNYALAAASHSSKLGPASFAPGLGSTAPSA